VNVRPVGRQPADSDSELLLGISAGGWLWLDFLVVGSFLAITAVVAAKTYPRAILWADAALPPRALQSRAIGRLDRCRV
jgi:hypothetical protein